MRPFGAEAARRQRICRSIGLFLLLASLAAATGGCRGSSEDSQAPADDAGKASLSVTVVKPQRTTLRRTVSQPGAIEAFERTPVFAKIAGYVSIWNVDIGDKVSEGDVLAEIDVPELFEELGQKEAVVEQAEQASNVADARAATSAAQLKEAQAGLPRAQAEHERWTLEFDRISKMASSAVIDQQTMDQTDQRLKSAAAALREAEAKIVSARAILQESEAAQKRARADVAVAEADARRLAAMWEYTALTAAYSGVITRRSINTGDFVQPPSGGKGEPLFVLERRDTMRVFVRVPEVDAVWVRKGATARVRVQGLQGEEFAGTVARTSYSLDAADRTLLAEIDLPNAHDRLRSGMYAYAAIIAELPDALTLPTSAVLTQGSITQGFEAACFVLRDGKVWRTPIRVGFSDGKRIEVLKKQSRPASQGSEAVWQDFPADETVVQDNVPQLTDGQAVSVHD